MAQRKLSEQLPLHWVFLKTKDLNYTTAFLSFFFFKLNPPPTTFTEKQLTWSTV